MSSHLQSTFESFANFGASKQQLSAVPSMDNARFAKMCRESGVVGKSCTPTDIDIIFKKVLTKGERRITFAQFQQAIKLLGEVKFPKDPAGTQKIADLLIAAEPSRNATQAKTGGIYGKLTDSSLYTGAHKHRFDSDGNGRGLEGRETITQTHDLSQIVNRTKSTPSTAAASSASKKRGQTNSMNALNEVAKKPAPSTKAAPANAPGKSLSITGTSTKNLSATGSAKDLSTSGSIKNLSATTSAKNLTASKGNLAVAKSAPTAASTGSLSKSNGSLNAGGSVYDRLTDTSKYTGAHKHRFDQNGMGRGIAGRR